MTIPYQVFVTEMLKKKKSKIMWQPFLFGFVWGLLFSRVALFFTNDNYVAVVVLLLFSFALLWGTKIMLEAKFKFIRKDR